MTITELAPLHSDRASLRDLLEALGDQLSRDGFARHEYAVQTLARSTSELTPGAAATLANRASSTASRAWAYQVVIRVLTRCGDLQTRTRVSGMLARYAYANA